MTRTIIDADWLEKYVLIISSDIYEEIYDKWRNEEWLSCDRYKDFEKSTNLIYVFVDDIAEYYTRLLDWYNFTDKHWRNLLMCKDFKNLLEDLNEYYNG